MTSEKLSYSEFIEEIIAAIQAEDPDSEMEWKAQIKTNFKVTDDQINSALFKRFSVSKITPITPEHEWVDIKKVAPLSYLMDGWMLKGDICLTYGQAGSGKTTYALWKAYNYAKGKNILDRSTGCEAGKTLFIATDSGLGALRASMDQLGIEDDDPVISGLEQKIFIWGFEPEQGHNAWAADINGVIKLEQFIKTQGITYIVIDSAKSVSSRGGWNYIDNQSVRTLLQYLREGVCQSQGCNLEFLSHDGTEKGAHAGAKSWAEEPSMVVRLDPVLKDDEQTSNPKQIGVKATFIKDRAAVVDPRRQVRFTLKDNQLELLPEEEIVGSCEKVIKSILWKSHRMGIHSLTRNEIQKKAYSEAKAKFKTVDNTLGALTAKRQLVKPKRGKYSLSPGVIQAFEEESLSLAGSNTTKEAGMTEKSQLPDVIPEEIAGTSQSLLGESGGNLLNLSYINQSNTCTSQEVETMTSAELQGSSWDLESNS